MDVASIIMPDPFQSFALRWEQNGVDNPYSQRGCGRRHRVAAARLHQPIQLQPERNSASPCLRPVPESCSCVPFDGEVSQGEDRDAHFDRVIEITRAAALRAKQARERTQGARRAGPS